MSVTENWLIDSFLYIVAYNEHLDIRISPLCSPWTASGFKESFK